MWQITVQIYQQQYYAIYYQGQVFLHVKPIIDYYNAWCTYPEGFSLEDLMRQCYDNFFMLWHKEYEYWVDNEDAIREELHHNQYEDQLYYENGDVYVEPLNEIV